MEKNNLNEIIEDIQEATQEIIQEEVVEFQSSEEKKSINKLAKELNRGGNIDGELLSNLENKIMSKREQKLLVQQYFRTKFIRDFFKIILAAFLITITFDYFITPTGRGGLFPAGAGAIARFFATLTFPNQDQVQLQSSFYFIYYFAINIPLFIFGYIKLGKKFTFTTFIFIIMQIGFDQIIQNIPFINPREFNLLVNYQLIGSMPGSWNTGIWLFIFAALGGFLLGFSYSIVYKIGSSTGGLDFLTVFLSNKTNKPVGSLNRKVNFIILAVVIVLNTIIIPMSLINSDIKINILQSGNYYQDNNLLKSMWDFAIENGALVGDNNNLQWDPVFEAWFSSIIYSNDYTSIESAKNLFDGSASLTKDQYEFLVQFVCKKGYGDDLVNVNRGLVWHIKFLFIFGPSLFASFSLVIFAGMSTNIFYPKYTVRTYMITTNTPKEINKMLLENGFQNDILNWDSINRINGNYLHRSVIMVAMSVMDWDKIEREIFMIDPQVKINAIITKSVRGLFNYEIKKNDDRDIIRTKIEKNELELEKIRQIAIVRAQKEHEKLHKKSQRRKPNSKKQDNNDKKD